MELTAPQLVSVVTVANERSSPRRTAPLFPQGCLWLVPPRTILRACSAAAVSRGLPRASAQYAVLTPARNSRAIAAHTARPCRGEPVIFPSVNVKANGIARIENISRKFVNGVGFSNGCALFTLKKPPPLVPSSLMISCEAVGPCRSLAASPASLHQRFAVRDHSPACHRHPIGGSNGSTNCTVS